ncbi:MAG: hypothetical protein JW910_16430 [Anaerolineae bacterium]|nr:hypothetical protein [Anaerolineae bacterium]
MSFGAFLVGTWERRFGIITNFQVINPTVEALTVHIAFCDTNGAVLGCNSLRLHPNETWEIPTPELDSNLQFGAVKIFSHDGEGMSKLGIVGYKRHILAVPAPAEVAFSEAPLAAVFPAGERDYPQEELDLILPQC